MDPDLLLCPVCKEYLDEAKDPRSLDCGHSYCFNCLQYLYQECEEKIACLECQEETSLPTGGLSAIRCNPFLVRHMRKSAQSNSTLGSTTNQTQAEFQELLTTMKSNGIAILSQNAALFEFVYEKKPMLLYALFYRQNRNVVEFQHTVSLFSKFAKIMTSHELGGSTNVRSEALIHFVAIDMDKCLFVPLNIRVNENDVFLWSSGSNRYTLINKEYMECFQEVNNVAFMRYNQTFSPTILERVPSIRAKISMGCPIEGCEIQNTKWDWLCCNCLAVLEYDFDNDKIFCDCGVWENSYELDCPTTYEASCGNSWHPFTMIEHSQMRNSLRNLPKMKDLNILVLGETGVGKSTWINAIANYATSDTLKEAESESNFRCLIKSAFARPSWKVFGTMLPTIKVPVTKIIDEAEYKRTVGDPDTNIPSSYLIPTRKYNVRIIDTPGIGDPRGKDKDMEHCEYILHFLTNSKFKEIHGICILLKSGTTRLSESFQYCLTELFKQLHKSAAQNIIFAFTSSRRSFFETDATLGILTKMLLVIKGADDVSVSAEIGKNVFLLDNETFEYLCLVRNKVSFDQDTIQGYEKSWNYSKLETEKLFKYAESLTPYDIHNSSSIYVARNLIARILKPALELHKTLRCNNISMEKALKDYESCPVTSGNKIYVAMKRPLNEPLNSRSYLCRSCTEIQIINRGGADGAKHKEEVHTICRVCQENISLWLGFKFALSSLIMTTMRRDYDPTCSTCGCKLRIHVLSSYSQTTVTYYDSVDSIQKLKDKLDETKRNLSKTASIIAKFAFFLQNSALAKYRDGIPGQIEVELKIVKNKEVSSEYSVHDKAQDIETLCAMKKAHEDEMKKFSSNMLLEPKQICELRDELYQIPSIGRELKRLVDIEEKVRTREIFQIETHFSRILRLALRRFDPYMYYAMPPFSRNEPFQHT